jgi:hypothetical protein
MFTRKPARRSLSNLPAVTGKQAGNLSFMTELKGSGGLTTVPSWDPLVRMCGFQRSAVKSIAIGAVAGGPFYHGERITAAGGKEGIVVGDCSATPLKYIVIGSDFANTDVITGAVSGASATASGAPSANQGYAWRPLSITRPPSGSLERYLDDTVEGVYGSRGTLKVTAKVGEPFMMDMDFRGVYDPLTDVATLEPDYETTVPPAVLDAALYLGTFAPVATTFTIDMGNSLADRDSLNAAKGILSAYIADREVKATLDPELTLAADHDYIGVLRAGTLGRLVAKAVGSGPPTQMVFATASPRLTWNSPSTPATSTTATTRS